MTRSRWGASCAVAVLALLAVACVPPTEPTQNLAPVAEATVAPDEGPAPLLVDFEGSGSTDPDGTIVGYEWDFGDGATSSEADPSHTYTDLGTYDAVLTVTDDGGATDTAAVTVTVTAPVNATPSAVATADVTSGGAPLVVTFDGSGSTDADGTIESYEWDFGGGATATGVGPTHTFTEVGEYAVVLTVTDDDGAQASTYLIITVTPAQPPAAVASADVLSGTAPLVVELDGSGSTDADGTIDSYEWDLGDGSPVVSGATVTHTFTAAGTYTVTLTVTDSDGLTDSTQLVVTVTENAAPVAIAAATPTSGTAPLLVELDARGATDADGWIVSTEWDPGDGSGLLFGEVVEHTYTVAGTYTATLTVTDDLGASDSASVTITVGEVANELPTAAIAATPTSGIAPLTVDFSAAGSADTDGTIESYDWVFGDGNSGTGIDPEHLYTEPGSYTAVVTVTDDRGGQASAAIEIEVVANVAPVAAVSATPTVGIAPLVVELSSVGSADSDGTIESYAWDLGDGATSSDANPTHTYTAAGEYTATLTVTDDRGAQDQASVVIAVVANQAPTALANADVQSGARPLSVTFDGSESVDADGEIVAYAWDFGDGATSDEANPTHVFDEGTWSVTLTVTDDRGATDTSAALVITAVVDDDADGVSPPLDCDDDDASAYPGAPDAFDDAGADTNCDGYDGVADEQVFVATAGADTATCGAPSEPCASIAHGQGRALALGRSTVGVAAGEYAAFSLANGVTVAGGFDADFQRGDAATGDVTVVVNGATNAAVGGTVAILADGLTQPSGVRDLVVEGLDAAAGQHSYGIIARNSGESLTLDSVHVIAGDGGQGAAGNAGSSATQSAAPGGGTGANAERSAQTCNTTRQAGGGGATTSTPGANGGGGGAGGQKDSSCTLGVCAGGACTSTAGLGGGNAATVVGSAGLAGGGGSRCDCGEAGTGGTGNPGRTQHGAGGQPTSAAVGTLDGAGLWASNSGIGGTGTLGLDGTGGGGGGGGGGNDNGTDARGAGGGGGGAGGARATVAGTGGRPGGASIGILVVNTQPTVIDVTIELGTGGAGGAGGAGGLGQPGGPGGNGGAPNSGGRGGNGGAGGTGGHSGGGAGGAGGPSIGLAVGGTGSVLADAITYSGGSVAPGGSGGGGGVPGTAGFAGLRLDVASL